MPVPPSPNSGYPTNNGYRNDKGNGSGNTSGNNPGNSSHQKGTGQVSIVPVNSGGGSRVNPNEARFGSPDRSKSNDLPVPQSAEAEEAILGSMLIDRDTIALVAPVLKARHFFSQVRANLYQALLNLFAEQIPGDMVTIKNELRAMGVLGNEGGADGEGKVSVAYLLKLIQSVPSPVHVLYYVSIMLNKWLARELIGAGAAVVSSAYQSGIEADQLLSQTVNRLQELAASIKGRDAAYLLPHERSLEHFFQVAAEQAQEDQKVNESNQSETSLHKKNQPRLRFGWPEFDGRDWADPPVLALLPSTLTTILGRTGGGKTLAALQIADANAEAGLNVLYFHVELNFEQLLARRFSRLTGIPVLNYLLRNFKEGDLEAIAHATGEVSKWPGRVDFIHCPNWSVEDLAQELRAHHYSLISKAGRGYDLVVLDYLQRLGSPKNCFNEREALANNVRRFSDVINELNITGLMTSQVGRSETRQFEPPDLDDGLGSGEIERCSNQVLAIAISQDKLEAKYAVRKNTFSQSEIAGSLTFDPRRSRFI